MERLLISSICLIQWPTLSLTIEMHLIQSNWIVDILFHNKYKQDFLICKKNLLWKMKIKDHQQIATVTNMYPNYIPEYIK